MKKRFFNKFPKTQQNGLINLNQLCGNIYLNQFPVWKNILPVLKMGLNVVNPSILKSKPQECSERYSQRYTKELIQGESIFL